MFQLIYAPKKCWWWWRSSFWWRNVSVNVNWEHIRILGYTSWFSIHEIVKTKELGCSHNILRWSAICIFNLRIRKHECDENTTALREEYAKLALLKFYPLRKLEDIQIDGSYWNLLEREVFLFKRNENTTMWKKGFDIKQQLIAQGGRDQLLLFLTGPSGAGKTTAIKADKVITDIQG